MDKLTALRIFCIAAQMPNFRQTALALSLSPQAVTRAIFFLEQEFGELLFIRNTRTTQITPFGEQVWQEAKIALQYSDDLFQKFSASERQNMAGIVRVALPDMDNFRLLNSVLEKLRDYPEIVLDWRDSNAYSHTEREQIDVGIRVGNIQDNDFIVKPIAPLRLQTVASPELLARWGEPHDVADLRARFPLIGMVNANSGRVFEWDYPDVRFIPDAPVFMSHQTFSALQAACHGVGVGQFASYSVRDAIRAGQLRPILLNDEITLTDWQLYVYRPKRHIQTARVKMVFDVLVESLQAWLG